jgi:CHAT domain-containing protein/tetratricopeptide (TPR) repeat protein
MLAAGALACGPAERAGGDALDVLARARLPRPFDAQLSIATAYRPCGEAATAPSDARCAPPAEPSRAVLAAAERASTAAAGGADPRALHAAGLMDLLWGREGGNSLDRSLSLLSAAARLSDRPAPALADLAAARLLRAERTGSPRDLLEAYEAAAQALEHEPRLAPALFNRALALERLGLADEAARAWEECAGAAPGTGWSAEARRRAREAARVPPYPPAPTRVEEAEAYAAADPQRALSLGMDRVLGEWGRLHLAGDAEGAAAALSLAEALGNALERRGRDGSLAGAARAVRALPARQADALARTHVAYAAARAHYEAGDYAGAGPGFEQVAADTAASVPLRAWALLFRGTTRVYAGRREEGERDIRAVAAAADPRRTPALAGRARWSLGTTLLRAGRYQDALAGYRAAEPLLRRAGEGEHVGAVQVLDGEARFRLGDTEGAYAALGRAAWTLRPHPGSLWLHTLLWLMADAAAADGLSRAALRLQDADVAAAALTGRPVYVTEAGLARAESRANAGDAAGAAADLDAAARGVDAMPPGPAAWFRARLRASQAAVAARTAPARSVAALDSAVAFFAPGGTVLLRRALVARADAKLVLGDVEGAASDLERATDRLAVIAEGVSGATGRAAFLDAARAVFDRMVMLRVRQGRPDAALAALERGRASLDPGGGGGAAPPRRTDAAGLAYALVGDTLLAWTVSGGTVRMARAVWRRDALRRTVERARSALEAGNAPAARAPLAALYDGLVRPVRAGLGGDGAPVVVAADGVVADAPFAALLDTVSGRYLVETHALRFAPSLRQAAWTGAGWEAEPRALVVADPAFDPGAWPGLRRLDGAAAEADSVAGLYPGAVVLAGAGADRRAFERALPHAQVVHYAGHALFDDARPGASALVLAPSADGGSGAFPAAELGRLPWGGVRLVVLSACRSLRGGGERSGGFAGLSGALLAAGAGGVVGSTGQVNDATTRTLMVAFHRAWRGSGDAAQALRQAQLQLLHSGDPSLRSPAAWGTFRYAGG